MYVLSRKQQNMMKEIKKVKQEWNMDQKLILRAKLNEMKAKNDLIQRKKDILKEENDKLKTKEQDWKTKENEWKTKENELKSKLQVNFRFLRKMAKKWKKKMPANKHKRYGVKKPEELGNILGSAGNKNMDLSEICTVLDKKYMESLKSESTKVKDEGLPGESSTMEVDKPQFRYHPRTLRNEHGNYPNWMNSKAIKKHKAKLKRRPFKKRAIKKK
ncbi:hypothetical protein TNIN_377031 [Trichonephila inaurata madagascariensis]|uniref:Uncharacterized protein n=1 Tax=Trichonephila inaurata madagascariensis TaxID=2747483 RepID=A0A8X7C2B6_9ARAC|nr:hypothetical protein TNIN_377031 [Trichonephila inaurata madagascariensis]